MGIRVYTTQWTPVYKVTPKKAAGGSNDEGIQAGQEIEVESLTPQKGDLVLVVWPPNLYPSYLGRGHLAYIEPEHIKPVGEVPPGNATLNSIMALLIEINKKLDSLSAKGG